MDVPTCGDPVSTIAILLRNLWNSFSSTLCSSVGMSSKGWEVGVVAVGRVVQDVGSESDDSVYYDVDSPPTASPDFPFFDIKSEEAGLREGLVRLRIKRQEEVEEERPPEEEPRVDSPPVNGIDGDCEELILMDKECYETTPAAESSVLSEDDDEPKPPLKRSSSLKCSRGSDENNSREKKIVRFADVMGLDLADVRTFMDEVPKVPKSAFRDLGVEPAPSPVGSPAVGGATTQAAPAKTVVPLFQPPGAQADFMEKLNRTKVCLETAHVSDPSLFTITGIVRVVNLDFNKTVYVRHTYDGWKSHADLKAKYVEGSCDGFSDRFRFVLFAHTLMVGQRLEFAIRYDVKGHQMWDNNRGANYAFQCIPDAPRPPVVSAYVPPSAPDHWGPFF